MMTTKTLIWMKMSTRAALSRLNDDIQDKWKGKPTKQRVQMKNEWKEKRKTIRGLMDSGAYNHHQNN